MSGWVFVPLRGASEAFLPGHTPLLPAECRSEGNCGRLFAFGEPFGGFVDDPLETPITGIGERRTGHLADERRVKAMIWGRQMAFHPSVYGGVNNEFV
jgi:hypothetical protein